jgi:cell division control protein 6
LENIETSVGDIVESADNSTGTSNGDDYKTGIEECIDHIKPTSIEFMWDSMQKVKIFQDKEKVTLTYVPKQVSEALHRGEVIYQFQRCLIDVSRKLSPDNIIVYGKMGTGKTFISRLITGDLQQVAESRGVNVTVLYINCEVASTETGVLGKINNELMKVLYGKIKTTIGNSKSRSGIDFTNLFDELDGLLIIILDEIDKMKNPNVVNILTRTFSAKTGQNPCLIMITNNAKFKSRLEGYTKSALGENEIQFDPYNAEQLMDILKERVKVAFYKNVVDEIVVPLVAAFSAQEHGDARKAMKLLRRSGEVAERLNLPKVGEAEVRLAQEEEEKDRISEIIKTLPTQSKLTLLAATALCQTKKNHVCHTGELYNDYTRYSEYIDTDVLTQRRITDLISELDTMGALNAVSVYKGRQGRTKDIHVHGARHLIVNLCLEDYRLKPLKAILKPIVFKKVPLNEG